MTKNKIIPSKAIDETEEKQPIPAVNSEDGEKSKFLAEKLEFFAERALVKENLPPSFAKILMDKSEEQTLKNIALFKKEFLSAVEEKLTERLKGKTPKTASVVTDEADPFLKGFNC